MTCVWIVLVAAWRTTIHPTPKHVKYEKQTLMCGNTTAEAEARGCTFDLMSHNWVPNPCLDHEIAGEFREFVNSPDRLYRAWPYYNDYEGKKWIEDERELALMADWNWDNDPRGLVVTTLEVHLKHCEFMIKRVHRSAVSHNVPLDSVFTMYRHIVHCLKQFREPGPPLGELSTPLYVGFTRCTIDVPVVE